MGSPIAAGSVVAVKSNLSGFELSARRPLLGICESAVAGVPPAPPTNVVIAWEDGTRVTYPDAKGLISAAAPTDPSLLGTVVQFGGTLVPFPILGAGNRIRGPVVMHSEYFDANGDPFVGPGEQNQVLTVKTELGYVSFPRPGFNVVPNA